MGDNRWLRNSFVYLIIFVAALALIAQYFNNGRSPSGDERTFNQVVEGALNGEICRLGERSEEHTSELQSRQYLVCRLLLEKKNKTDHRLPVIAAPRASAYATRSVLTLDVYSARLAASSFTHPSTLLYLPLSYSP